MANVFSKAWGFVTGGSKTSRDLFDRKNGHLKNFGEWIGNSKFTAEEMAELDAETAKGVREFAIATMHENTDRSKSRRACAELVIKSYILFIFCSCVVYPFNEDAAQFWFAAANQSHLGWLAIAVGGFFWGTHALRAHKTSK